MSPVSRATGSLYVRNVVGSAGRSPSCPNCGPWIEHWQLLSGHVHSTCSVKGCNNPASVGAHVTILFSLDDKQHIIPMCSEHNGKHGGVLEAKPGTIFVRANVAESCGQ